MVLDHHLLDGYSGMTLIAFQNGKPIFRDGKVGIEQTCCCNECPPCPDFSTYCVTLTLTDYNGNVSTADEGDIFWDDEGTYGSVFIGGFEYSVEIVCVQGVLTVAVFWAGFIQNCNCTAGYGELIQSCTYVVDNATIDIVFGDAGGPCNQNCPASPGSLTVTISEPPC